MHANPLTALGRVWRIQKLNPDSSTEKKLAMAQQGSDNNDAFMGSAMQFMQAGQNMAQQFMDFIGKAGNPAAAIPPRCRSAGTDRAAEAVHGSADVALAVGARQAAGQGSSFQGRARVRRSPFFGARMAREPGLRLPASGLPAQHEIPQGDGRADPGRRRQGAQSHALSGAPDCRCHGAFQLCRDQSRNSSSWRWKPRARALPTASTT